ncbi:adenosylmethionine--8-amino-7-oxononanoate transaminase [Zhihengliuella salsuginis]|uniref:Adenosylmethionine-8-amino-7-oxononanoate aminotransferase n=1 Tax=Zhihengliuella salsuginis TaxID=578222 RepID=A0ABQ3GA19_9MICC|nr:adenosylmethionine--8-amino-7-oxononanoate transaminase [Zhihengliuella salsuginis]GHC99329.1 adenosylmethionine--8-amino-7-oxononanoate aminotransferase BioA [Zhihengliuella salsuginis]
MSGAGLVAQDTGLLAQDTGLLERGGGLLERDAGLLWHPYAPLDGGALYGVTGASGACLTLDDGVRERHVVDGMASWWSAVHGYGHPVLDAAAAAQIGQFSHVMFGGLTHAPAVGLAERLARIAPAGLDHVFLADSGSVSVEVALKVALQYQAASGRSARQRFLAVRGGYHGDTFAAMSVCDPVDGMHSAFPGLVAEQVFVPRPPAARLVGDGPEGGRWEYDDDALAAWEANLERIAAAEEGSLAGIIVEPVVQGAGGMHFYPPAALRALRRVADRWDLVLIADEIATGLGRTGRLWGCDWAGIAPDVLCAGKALTGGYLTLAAVVCSTRVARAVSDSEHRAILHGPTFMGNPLACRVASASLDLLTVPEHDGGPPPWQVSVAALHRGLTAALAPARALSSVREVRVLGGIGVVELGGSVDVTAVTRAAVEAGAWVRPFRNLVYVMPPYVASPAEVAQLGDAVTGAIAQVHG